MFCTGGIRCEKATSFLLDEGYESVYHLEGGILKYLEEVPEENSLWEGDCFVFDNRVSVRHGLVEGEYDMCHACRHPVDAEDIASPKFHRGISCPHCYDETSDTEARFAEREKRSPWHARGIKSISVSIPVLHQRLGFSHDGSHPVLIQALLLCNARPNGAPDRWIPRLREVVLRDKPQEMLDISPKGTVPVLQRNDGAVLDESLDIMRWALEEHDPEGWLAPALGTLSEVDELIAMNDGDFKHHLDRYKYANRYDGADPEVHRRGAEIFLSQLETRLQSQDALFGARWCLADAAIGPFVRQFANADRAWFDARRTLAATLAWRIPRRPSLHRDYGQARPVEDR